MDKVFAARIYRGNTNRWDDSVLSTIRTTSSFPRKSHYAIVCPVNKTITMNKVLDTHLNGGATVIISSNREGFIPGWERTNVILSLWIVCDKGVFRLCAYDNYNKFISRWSILYECPYVIIEKNKLAM
jgi:hypothetical protein